MYKHNLPSKWSYLLIGSLSYMALGVLAFIFYKERTCFVDISFHLFEILQEGNYQIQNYRFGSVFTQSVPLLASYADLSLETIAKLYSVGFVVYYYLIFLACLLLFNEKRWALIMLLFSTFMVTDTFYWIQSEFPQGLAFMILYFAFLSYKQQCIKTSLVLELVNLLFLITLAFFHPLLIIPFGFTVGYLYWNGFLHRFMLIQNSLIYFGAYLIKFFLFKTEYDGSSMSGLKNIITLFPDYFNIPSNRNFLQYLVEDYYLLGIGFILIVWGYLSNKNYLKTLFFISIFMGYLLLINIFRPAEMEDQFYIENLYLPLSLFIILPLVFEYSPKLPVSLNTLLLVIILALRINHIGLSHTPFTERLEWKREIMNITAQHPQPKVIIDQKIIPQEYQSMEWASAFEFWLLSTIEKNNTRSIVISEDPDKYNTPLWQFDLFLTEWEHYKYKDLPDQYFMLRDTSTYYRKVMTLDELYNKD